MFSHIMVGSNDLDRSKTFYDAALGALGIPAASLDGGRLFYRHEGGALGVTPPLNGEPATAANGGTIGFTCASPDLVEAWHAAGVANGGTTCEDPPGLRDFDQYCSSLPNSGSGGSGLSQEDSIPVTPPPPPNLMFPVYFADQVNLSVLQVEMARAVAKPPAPGT